MWSSVQHCLSLFLNTWTIVFICKHTQTLSLMKTCLLDQTQLRILMVCWRVTLFSAESYCWVCACLSAFPPDRSERRSADPHGWECWGWSLWYVQHVIPLVFSCHSSTFTQCLTWSCLETMGYINGQVQPEGKYLHARRATEWNGVVSLLFLFSCWIPRSPHSHPLTGPPCTSRTSACRVLSPSWRGAGSRGWGLAGACGSCQPPPGLWGCHRNSGSDPAARRPPAAATTDTHSAAPQTSFPQPRWGLQRAE